MGLGLGTITNPVFIIMWVWVIIEGLKVSNWFLVRLSVSAILLLAFLIWLSFYT